MCVFFSHCILFKVSTYTLSKIFNTAVMFEVIVKASKYLTSFDNILQYDLYS